MHLAIFIVATATSGTLVSNRLQLSFPKHFFISVFEWFGELGLFCVRLLPAWLLPTNSGNCFVSVMRSGRSHCHW
jgi:hypothetical protein